MKAMILAAGRGERMGELTVATPKPLLKVAGQYLIEYSLRACKAAGINDVIINVSYHGGRIQAAIGDGAQYGLNVVYSVEPERLETGGGIVKALAFFEDQPFLVLSSDIITDFPLQTVMRAPAHKAHLVMVANPSFHAEGDFGICDGYANFDVSPKLTFANIGVYHPELFLHATPSRFPLNQLLFPAISQKLITAEQYHGRWYNVGSPKELASVVIE